MELKDKVALVLGAVKGIGNGIGLALAQEGAKIALNYFDREESLEEMQQDFAKTDQDHLIIRTNLLRTDKIPGLIKNVVDHFGRLDILINNIERGGWPVVHEIALKFRVISKLVNPSVLIFPSMIACLFHKLRIVGQNTFW